MNYLAHCLLAENDPQSLVGNLMADAIPRGRFDRLPPRVQRGILQHRRVDGFTDRHAVTLRSIHRLNRSWGWFGGIIMDIYYDHLLAESWDTYCPESLRDFCDHTNDILAEQMDEMPPEAQHLARRLIDLDRLYSYGTLDGIGSALTSVSERLHDRMPKLRIELQDALPELHAAHGALLEDFNEFFPQLMAFSRAWVEQTAPVLQTA